METVIVLLLVVAMAIVGFLMVSGGGHRQTA